MKKIQECSDNEVIEEEFKLTLSILSSHIREFIKMRNKRPSIIIMHPSFRSQLFDDPLFGSLYFNTYSCLSSYESSIFGIPIEYCDEYAVYLK